MTSAPREGADSGERALLRDAVSDFVARGTDLKRVRRLRGAQPEFDREVWSQLAEFGWLGILVPEQHGGLGLGLAEMAIAAQGLARALIPEPLTASAVLATRSIVHGDNDALKQLLLPKLVGGESTAALAWQETAGNLDCNAVQTRAENVADGVRLNGSKQFIAGASGADGFVVSAQSAQGLAVYWVPRTTPGVELSFELLADGRHYGTVRLNDVKIPQSDCVASAACARAALARACDEGAVIASAELTGVMSRALEITLDYMKTRVQFGKPIGSFQALQHRSVDLYIQQELASAALDEATAKIDAGCDERTRAALASRIKARASEAGLLITRQAIQLHGAIGYTEECDIGLFLKRALTLSAWLGNATTHRRRYAALSAAAH